jgi:hypothetical protein
LGDDDPRTLVLLAQLGSNLLQQKKYVDAEPPLRECLKGYQQQQPNVWTTFNMQSLLGAALLGQKKYAEAEPLLLAGYEGLKEGQDMIPAQVRGQRLTAAALRLVQLYDATKKKDEAARWRKKAEEN